jgi:hypothetical protein
MTATCTYCEITFRNVARNEDGSLAIENTNCAHLGCDVYRCRAGCEHLSFQCEGCRRRFCVKHQVTLDGLPYCLGCAVEEVENQEPECECRQTDVDMLDAAGCEFHNPASPWNARLRAVTAIQQYEQQHQDQRREKYGLAKR